MVQCNPKFDVVVIIGIASAIMPQCIGFWRCYGICFCRLQQVQYVLGCSPDLMNTPESSLTFMYTLYLYNLFILKSVEKLIHAIYCPSKIIGWSLVGVRSEVVDRRARIVRITRNSAQTREAPS